MGLVASSAAADEIDNPEFKAWSGFGVGSFVEYSMVTKGPGYETKMLMTITIVEKTEAKIVIETRMKMSGNEMPGQRRDILSSMETADGWGSAPPGYKETEGEETIEAAGLSFDCHWSAATRGSSGNKQWRSDRIPGGLVKSETTGASNTTITLAKFEAK